MPTRPDIVVVLTDQQRPDSCGVFGQQLPVTPVLDRLATDGMAFDESFTVQPLCGPSRSVLQTGLMPTATGCWRNGRCLPRDVDTLASRLAALGYWTGYVGKWHLASDGGYLPTLGGSATRFGTRPIPPERRGGYRDAWIASDALEMTSGPTSGHLFDANGERVELHGYRVDAITASGRLDDTLIVFSSDHGSHFRTRNLEYKRSPHDASIRVPLVVRGPGFSGGRRCGALVSNLDLVPTLVTAAGGDDPDLHGTPLQRLLDGSAERSSVLVQISESQVGRALRTPDHTYAVRGHGLGALAGYRHAQAANYTDHLLYDLRADPAQRHNLITDPATAELRHTLAAQLIDQVEHFEGYRPTLVHR